MLFGQTLVIRGAQDWMKGTVPLPYDLDDHHIVPKSWGKTRENDPDGNIDSILNRTPLTVDTNRNVIRERLPNQYLPDLIAKSGETNVRSTFESHFISSTAFDILLRDPFTSDDFKEFLQDRRRTIQDGIEDLLVKERLDLAPRLRELDAKIEVVELSLRSSVDRTLGGDPSLLPLHVRQKIDERIQKETRKSLVIDGREFDSLIRKLEFADLRELQDTIANKNLWGLFEKQFGNREMLYKRFGQLAELRNGIRHSRNVNEIVRKEGEAAILWFEQVTST